MESVMKLLKENETCKSKIALHYLKINQLKEQIKRNEKIIFKNCKHEWRYDDSCGCHDRIKYKCVGCNLWRNEYMYS